MMKKPAGAPQKFDSLSQLHGIFGLPKPLHPLVSLVNIEDTQALPEDFGNLLLLNFYKIAYKNTLAGKARYGQNFYDFSEGGLIFTAPNQVFEAPNGKSTASGKLLLIHPDFLLGHPLARKIKQYGFFGYATNEALHLSGSEQETIFSIFKIIHNELHNSIDNFSQDIMLSQIEGLLNYSDRFYRRQFLTRKAVNNDLLQKMEDLLEEYFSGEKALTDGLPTVHYVSQHLHVSPSYLSDMLRALTGQNAQQHIHEKLIEKAKERLAGSELSVSEVAYELGFEHPQSFSKLFKSKTLMTPLEFKHSFL